VFGDEFSHTIKQHVEQVVSEIRPFVYGHIANYDEQTHRVRCIIPSMQDANGQPLLSPWMPMMTMSAANSGSGGPYGGQIIYQGGATAQNPTQGEQVVIALFSRNRGVAVCLGTTFNTDNAPPATKLPDGAAPNEPGDFLWSNPSGALFRVRANGDIEFWTKNRLIYHADSSMQVETPVAAFSGNLTVGAGATGSFTAATGQIITVQDGIIINIT
jgi:phage baseplate assembly protein gpV